MKVDLYAPNLQCIPVNIINVMYLSLICSGYTENLIVHVVYGK